jgi:hypothetical protein
VAGPRVLFISPGVEDYLADSVFHGLRTLLGADCVDFPKASYMYDSFPRTGELYGNGFTLYGLLPEIDVDRSPPEPEEFDLVVFGDIWRTYDTYLRLAPRLRRERVAVLDGHDRLEVFPYMRQVPRWWHMPRVYRRHPYFKRELTRWARIFGGDIRPISFAIPEQKIVAAPPAKTKDFNAHIVDPEVAAAVGGQTSYAFSDEAEYYADLQASRWGITAKRAGWDALRHYEIAANGAVPCFRDLDRKRSTCAPHGLAAGVNCVVHSGWDDLRRKLDTIGDGEYARLQQGALEWARSSTTRRRAEQLLGEMGL